MTYTDEMCDFLRKHSKDNTITDMHKMFCTEFNCNVSIHGIRAKIKQLGLSYKRAEFYGSCQFSKEVVDYIRANVSDLSNRELTDKVNDVFNVGITKTQVRSIKAHIGIKSNLTRGQAVIQARPKDWVNPSKGKKLSPERYERIRKAFFKKGFNGLPPCPVGTERFRKGRVYIKIEEPDVWIPKANYMYEKATGTKLGKGDIIVLLDGSQDNFDIENLMLVSRAEVLRYNQTGITEKDNASLNKVVYSMHKLTRLRRERENSQKTK